MYEAIMRYMVLDQDMRAVKQDTLSANTTLPEGYKAQYAPRIRCLDCPGKLYTASPEEPMGNFTLHINNRQHKQNVERRTGRTSS